MAQGLLVCSHDPTVREVSMGELQMRRDELLPGAQGATSRPATPFYVQNYGNQAAQADLLGLQGEPVDIIAYDEEGDMAIDDARLGEELIRPAESVPFGDIAGLVDNVLAQAGDRPIGTLKIAAHAESGTLYLGQGMETRTIGLHAWPEALEEFARLRDHFAPSGRVEFHACNFAEFDRGQAMIGQLAAVLGVPVSAGSRIQFGANPGLEGSTWTAIPDAEGHVEMFRIPSDSDGALMKMEGLAHSWTALKRGDASALLSWVFGEDENE